MDNNQFLAYLREHSLEEGRAYIQAHVAELTDYAAIGVLIKDEALRQMYIAPFVSLKLAELLIFFGEYCHCTQSRALGLIAKGDALTYMGHYQSAWIYLDAAGEEFLRLGDKVGWARTCLCRIIASAWLGHIEEALQIAAQARDVFLQHNESYRACTVDANTAVVYTQLGRYQDALMLYESMLAIYPTLTDQSEAVIKRAIAMAEANQANNLSLLGNFEKASRLFKQAQSSFMDLEQIGAVVKIEMHLAELDYTQGYYGSAIQRYYQARDSLVQRNINDPILLAQLKLRITDCLVKLNRAQEACQLAAEAVETYRQLGISMDTGEALREYATALIASGRSKEALAAFEEAWTLFNRGGFAPYAFATKLQQAELLLDRGSFSEAYDQAHFAKEYFDAHHLIARSTRASLVMAGALIEESVRQTELQKELKPQSMLLQEAVLLCEQVSHVARQHNLQEEAYRSQYLLGRIALIQEKLTTASRHYKNAITQIERILDDLGHDLSPSFLHTAWIVYGQMIALCLQQGQVERAFNYLERARSIALRQYLDKPRVLHDKNEGITSSSTSQTNSATILQIQHELGLWQQEYRKYSVQLATLDASVSSSIDREVIQVALKQCEAKISELFERLHLHQSGIRLTGRNKKRETRKAQLVDVAELRQHLAQDQLLLAYFLYEDRLIIFAATTEQLVIREHPDGAAQLERLLPLLHAHLQPAGWPNAQQPPQMAILRLLNKLYDLLVAPVASLLPSSSGSLTVVPYGSLHNLPFHALYDGTHFLIENFQINYLPASSILMHLGRHTSEQKDHPMDTPVSTRPPLVFGYSGNGHLQRVLDEASTVAEMLNGCCYLEGEASIARLIQQAPGSPIIHLATHGQSRLDAPNFSYVRLADGQLNAIDAFSMNLERCELVTLSGCETGLALSSGGDEQLGLGRAFLAAGADSLLMSLWPVEDNATTELMQLFYRHLLDGKSKGQALRAAQCDLLYRTSSNYTHPYFWAAFRLVGEAGTLQFKGHRKQSLALESAP